MIKMMCVLSVVVFLSACDDRSNKDIINANKQSWSNRVPMLTETLVFSHHTETNLCFAWAETASHRVMSNVPCTPEVLKLSVYPK